MVRVLQAVLSLLVTIKRPENSGINGHLPDIEDIFRPGLSDHAEIILPGSQWASKVKQRWTTYRAPNFIAAIKPATISDVQHIVRTASKHDVPFFATGGGHGVSDYSRFSGISIDLSNFDDIFVNTTSNTVTVGASTQHGALSHALYKANRELPLASCGCIGVIGSTLGAGISTLQGHRGFLMDSLLRVKMVTANGDVVSASAAENPDLFWALHGAGANFGVVVSATYRTHEQTNGGDVTVIDFVYPADANQSYYTVLASYNEREMPSKLAITAVAVYNRDMQMPVLVAHSIYYGPQHEAEKYLRPFSDLTPIVQSTKTVPQTELLTPDHGSCTPNQRINIYSIALQKVEPTTFGLFYENMVAMWTKYPDYDGRLLVERYPHGAIDGKAQHQDSYPWRQATALMNIESFYVDPAHDSAIDRVVKAGRDEFAKTSGYSELAAYVNFAHGDEGPAAWYGKANLPKLKRLKQEWDPKQLFSWNNPISLD